MAMQENYDSVIRWNRSSLKCMGCWPNSNNKSNLLSTCQFFISAFMLFYFTTAPQTADLIMISRDIDSVIENLSNSNISDTNALIKLLVWWRNRKVLWKLIKFIKDDWEKPKTEMEYAEMIDVAKLGRSITKGMIIMTQSMVGVCLCLQLYLNIAGIYPTRRLYFKSYFPYNTSVTPVYEITWILQLITGILGALAYTSVDSFIGFSVLHVCGQLSILKNQLRSLSSFNAREDPSSLDFVRQQLRHITQRHAQLINFAETIEDIFNVMFLIQMLSLTIQICLQSFQCLAALSSEQLIVQTSEIRDAAYECEWYNLPVNEIKALAFIMLRTQKPPYFTAGKFCPFTMVTFSQVLKTAIGYLSVLLTIRES